jgi:hypothetical protein
MNAQKSNIQYGVKNQLSSRRPLISLWKKTYMVEEGQQAILSCRVKVSLNFSYPTKKMAKENNIVLAGRVSFESSG